MTTQPVDSIEYFIKIVKRQISFHRKRVADPKILPKALLNHQSLLKDFTALGNFLKSLPQINQTKFINKSAGLLSLTPQDIEGLPDEVRKELSLTELDEMNFAIMNLIEEKGGQTTLDHLVIGLYHKLGKPIKRAKVSSAAYKMMQRGLIFSIPKIKGAYSLTPIASDVGQGQEVTQD